MRAIARALVDVVLVALAILCLLLAVVLAYADRIAWAIILAVAGVAAMWIATWRWDQPDRR